MIIKGLLFSLLIFVSIMASVSDLQCGQVHNKLLICGLSIGVILDFTYYLLYRQIIGSFLINLAVVSLISILFYGFHVWSSGDSKLLILLMLLVPGKIYSNTGGSVSPCILVFIFIFSIGFIYVIAESIILGVKKGDILSLKEVRFSFSNFIVRFVSISSILFLLSQIISTILPTFFSENQLLILFINLFIILLIQDQKWISRFICAIPLALICVGIFIFTKECYVINWHIYIVIALIILLRIFAEKYNYEVIETCKIKPGMILALGTILLFQQSHVKGLPKYTTEDLRTKLTDEEVEAIYRWERSKFGKHTVVIVRKLPFAIIISLSTILFIITEVFII